MRTYSIALFLHIVGVLGMFVALGLEWTGLWQVRAAPLPDPVRGWMGIFRSMRTFGFISMMATVLTGIYLMASAWGAAPWILVTLGALVLVVALAQALTAPRMAAVGQALAAGKGALSETFYSRVNHPLLSISLHTRIALALGIIFLKIARPDLALSLLTVGVAILLGIASAVPSLHRANAHQKLAQ